MTAFCRLLPVASFNCGSASVAVSIYSEPESSIRGCQVTGDTPCNAGRCISLNPMDRRKGSMVNILRGQADKTATAELLGNSDHPRGKLGEIAEALLEPLADDALIAKAEDEL